MDELGRKVREVKGVISDAPEVTEREAEEVVESVVIGVMAQVAVLLTADAKVPLACE